MGAKNFPFKFQKGGLRFNSLMPAHNNRPCSLVLRSRIWLISVVLILGAASGRAQLVADGTTATINGTSTNLAGALTVGTNGSFTTLMIRNGGAVTNGGTAAIGL